MHVITHKRTCRRQPREDASYVDLNIEQLRRGHKQIHKQKTQIPESKTTMGTCYAYCMF